MLDMRSPQPCILVAPLDWGLGHATRCIPIVKALRARGAKVVIAGCGPHVELLLREFPDCLIVPMVNYSISYASSPFLLAAKFPAMLARVCLCAYREHRQLAFILRKHRINGVISDQRFGCWSSTVRCVYVTHQLYLKMPPAFSWLEPLFAHLLRVTANRFNEVWIPDLEGPNNLTGDLTRKYPLPRRFRFIGLLSRFSTINAETICRQNDPDLLVTLSGPEPQRSILERRILAQTHDFPGSIVILPGRNPSDRDKLTSPNLRIVTNASTASIHSLLTNARTIICRGGYTTIMELVSLGRTAALVPTPGQSEQAYLCCYLAARGRFLLRQQASLDIRETYQVLKTLPAQLLPPHDSGALQQAVEEFLDSLCGHSQQTPSHSLS